MRRSIALLLCLLAGVARADEDFRAVSLADLGTEVPKSIARDDRRLPYAALDGPGEAYLHFADGRHWGFVPASAVELTVKAPAGAEVAGLLVLPAEEGWARVRFRLPAGASTERAAERFHAAKQHFYRVLLTKRVAGAAWFRHRLMEVAGARELTDRELLNNVGLHEWERSFDFFTGGRAVSENLQLRRGMPGGKAAAPTVPLDSLRGITVNEMDWTPHLAGLDVEPDVLASHVPADQFALFFPDFPALLKVTDAADESGTPILHSVERRTEDARTRARYERQLGLATDFLSRQLGPHVIRSVVLTASDPFLREGTDVAVLFEAVDPAALAQIIEARRTARSQAEPGVRPVRGEVDGIGYHGLVSDHRVVCSYQATIEGAVVVSNSLHQLAQVARAARERIESLATLPEYTYFRHRYRRGAPEETALLVIPDAAIRKWCGPRWRIAASRRVRAGAVLAGLQARHIDQVAAGAMEAVVVEAPWPIVDAGRLVADHRGVHSSLYNTQSFLTPIAELEFTHATKDEARFYEQWRNGYERNWSNFFDPVAVRFTVAEKRLAADLTVMPLIVRSDYRTWIDIVKGARIEPGAGDPHEGALAHLVLAINTKNPFVKMGPGFLAMAGAKLDPNPLSWMGESLALYLDRDAVFDEALRAEDPEAYMEENVHRLPIALHCEVKSPMKATLFLASVRGWIEQTAPGMTEWSNKKHGEQDYVKVAPSAKARAESRDMEMLALYYAITPDRLVLTLNEDVLKRALDRRLEQRAAKEPHVWPAEHIVLRVDRGLLTVFDRILGADGFRTVMRDRSWGNLFILNEWKRRQPGRDPVVLHERAFGVRLVCPGGGRYAWNEEWRTMESTAFGHPAAPKPGPEDVLPFRGWRKAEFGLTFEKDGLRAACELAR